MALSSQSSVSRDVSSVVALGILVGISMISLSLMGLLGRLTTASVATCLLLALGASVFYARGSGAFGIPGSIWIALPLLVPSILAALLLPPYTWDEVAYGAALPRDFARAGHLFYNSDYGAYAAFPANYEALVTASVILTSDVRVTQLLNVGLALAMALIATLLARKLGVAKSPALLAGLFVLCAPVVVETAPRTKNDVASAFFQALAVLVLVECLERHVYPAVILSGAFLGVSLGVKYSSLLFALALAPFAVLFITRSATSRTDALKRLSLWAASLAVFGSPWYVRNLVLFSNPMFPFMNDWLGSHEGFTREHSALLRECFDGLRDFSLRTGTVATFETKIVSGFGVLPMTLLVPGALFALRPAHRGIGILLTGSAVCHLLLTLFVGFWEPRYFLSLLVLSSALAALALQGIGNAAEHMGLAPFRPAWLALLAATVVSVWSAYPYLRDNCRNVRAIRREGPEAFVEARAPYFAVARWLNVHISQHDRVAIGFNVQPFYYLERPYYHIHPLTEGDLVSAQTPQEVEAALRSIGATLLAFSDSDHTYHEDTAPRICAYRERLWRAQRQLRKAGHLRLLAEVSGVRILELVSGPASQ